MPEFAALLGTPPDPGDPLTAQGRAQRTAAEVMRYARTWAGPWSPRCWRRAPPRCRRSPGSCLRRWRAWAAALNLIASQLAVSLDNAQVYAGYRRIADEQAALRRVATLVARAAPPQEVFTAVTEEIGQLLRTDFAILVRYVLPDTIELVGTWTGTGAPAPTPVGTRLPLGGRNITTLVHQTGRPARVDYDDAISGVSGQVATRDWGLRTSVGVPVSVEGRLWGCMVAGFTRPELLPPDTEGRLAGFTELVATAIASAEAQAEVTASRVRIVAAADQARRRIERDLHDGAHQRLVTLALKLHAAQTAAPPSSAGKSTRPSPRPLMRSRNCARPHAAFPLTTSLPPSP